MPFNQESKGASGAPVTDTGTVDAGERALAAARGRKRAGV